MKKAYTFALAGNQNCGKTTLFNLLTGANQHVGNWPGVTVEQKTGAMVYELPPDGGWKTQDETHVEIQLVDLPGIYSLSPYSMEEIISRNYITMEKPDVVLNVVDATNLERNLYLTLQLAELGTPMVVALNMMDEVRARGDVIHRELLARGLHVPVIPICARTGEGTEELVQTAIEWAERKSIRQPPDLYAGDARLAHLAVSQLIESKARTAGLTAGYAAAKLMEGDEPMGRQLGLSQEEQRIAEQIISGMEASLGMERAAVMADLRYRYIEKLLSKAVERRQSPDQLTLSDRLDRVLTHPWLAIPVFLAAMLLIFTVTFGAIGTSISDAFSMLIDNAISAADAFLAKARVADWLRELVVDGMLTGVGSVLSFMPTILLLFMCLSILEDSGYMARAAFLMDKPLQKIGLNGRSFIPLLMGFGCTVPAAMASRSMSNRRDRCFTILLTPFMSCGAKVPVYALFAKAFFQEHQVLVMAGLYLGGILMAALAGLVLSRTLFRGDAAPFLMELPAYRLPTLRNVVRNMADKAKDFVRRAFTVIFLATVAVWFLQSFTFSLNTAPTIRESMLGHLAGAIAPVFSSMGFDSVEASTAILTGVMAKESVVSTLAILADVEVESGAMLTALRGMFPSNASVIAFLTFVLLYSPCVAALAAMKREMDSTRWALASALLQTGTAWVCAQVVYRVALIAGL